MMMSPDGSKVLVQVEDQGGPRVYLVEDVPKAPNGAAINATNPAQSEVPVRKVTGIGGEFATWPPTAGTSTTRSATRCSRTT